jgi:hypothetical protein
VLLVNMAGLVSGWSLTSGPGSVTPDNTAQTLAIVSPGVTATVTERLYPVVSGRNYRVKWTTSGTTCGLGLGNVAGGVQYKSADTIDEPLGANSFITLTTGPNLYVRFQKTAAGTSVVGSIALEQID